MMLLILPLLATSKCSILFCCIECLTMRRSCGSGPTCLGLGFGFGFGLGLGL